MNKYTVTVREIRDRVFEVEGETFNCAHNEALSQVLPVWGNDKPSYDPFVVKIEFKQPN